MKSIIDPQFTHAQNGIRRAEWVLRVKARDRQILDNFKARVSSISGAIPARNPGFFRVFLILTPSQKNCRLQFVDQFLQRAMTSMTPIVTFLKAHGVF